MSRQFGESPRALQAFEDYWQLGDGRSLAALAAVYQRQSDGGEDVPTRYLRRLEEWSAQFGWQQRVKQRIAGQAAEINSRLLERHAQNKLAAYNIAEVELTRLHRKVRRVGEQAFLEDKEADPLLATSAGGLASLVKVMQDLAGEAQKHEVLLPRDTWYPPDHSHTVKAVMEDPELCELAARIVARRPAAATESDAATEVTRSGWVEEDDSDEAWVQRDPPDEITVSQMLADPEMRALGCKVRDRLLRDDPVPQKGEQPADLSGRT